MRKLPTYERFLVEATKKGLPAVDYVEPKDQARKAEIEQFLKSKLEPQGLVFVSRDGEKFKLDSIKTVYKPHSRFSGEMFGYAFGMSKFDMIRDVSPGIFRYADREAKKAIQEAIAHFKLQDLIQYDSGHGVFVFNFFEPSSQQSIQQ